MTDPTTRVRAILDAAGTEPYFATLARADKVSLALLPAALDVVARVIEGGHGDCTCAAMTTDGEGPRPIGNGRFYHYQGCDHDPDLAAALDAYHAKERETL